MIELKIIANHLEDDLNAIMVGSVTKFVIHDNWGNYEKLQKKLLVKDYTCYGVLLPSSSNITPVDGLDAFYLNYVVRMTCKVEVIDSVISVINAYIAANVGVSGVLDKYTYVVNFDVPEIISRDVVGNIGDSAEIMFSMSYQFIKGGKLSNMTVLSINGASMTLLSTSLTRSRIGETENLLSNTVEMQTVITQQGLTISMTVPYLNNDVVEQLARDIAGGALDTTYMLSYKDGNIDKTWRVVLKDGDISVEPQKIQLIAVSFLITREDLTEGEI